VRVVLCLRVSTSGQPVEKQRSELQRAPLPLGVRQGSIYHDKRISGANGREDRRGSMLKSVRGACDVLIGWDVSCLGRSLADLAWR
jgi:DNA invertase Pin-like site-specific DNA recombinase